MELTYFELRIANFGFLISNFEISTLCSPAHAQFYWLLISLIAHWGLPMRCFCAKPLVQANVSHYTIHSGLTRIFHESPAATVDMDALPGVFGCRTLRRTVQVRLGSNPLWLPGGPPIFTVSQLQFMKHPG